MEELFKTLGKKITLKRKRKRMSQETLAELSGLHRNTIGCIERGEYDAALSSVAKIATALNCTLENLFKNL